jgi:hypothetical protein
MATEDTTLTTLNTKGETVIVPVPKGSFIHLAVPALHRNRALALKNLTWC